MQKKVIAIRHAECIGNTRGLISSDADSLLSNFGKSQAKAMSARFISSNVNKVFVTSSARTSETAKILFPHASQLLDDRLSEINVGKWKNSTWADYYDHNPSHKNMSLLELPTFEDGESYNHLIDRVDSFWREVVLTETSDIAIVAHGGSLGALLISALDFSNDRRWIYGKFEISNCEGFEIRFDEQGRIKIKWVSIDVDLVTMPNK